MSETSEATMDRIRLYNDVVTSLFSTNQSSINSAIKTINTPSRFFYQNAVAVYIPPAAIERLTLATLAKILSKSDSPALISTIPVAKSAKSYGYYGMEFLDDAMRMGAEQPYTIAAKGVTNGLSKTVSSQKQLRQLVGTAENAKNGGGFMNSVSDAQSVLDAVHSGKATFLGTNKTGFPVYRFNGVTGTNVNAGAGITGQSTNVFIIKGTTSPSVVPTNPFWKP